MSLQQVLEDTKKQLAELEAKEEGEEEVVEESVEEDQPKEEDAPAEEPAKEEHEVKEQEEEKAPDSAAFARLRREKAALEKQLREKEASAAQEEPKDDGYDPEIEDLKRRNRIERAQREFQSLEADIIATDPDYPSIMSQYLAGLYQANKLRNPRASHDDLVEVTREEFLKKAGSYQARGFHAAEEMYEEAKLAGYKAQKQQKQEDSVEEVEEKRPNLDRVAKNKARSSAMTGAKGDGGEARMSKKHAATNLTSAEWAALPAAERQRIMMSQD